MNKETTTFTVRTSPEIKSQIEAIISEIMRDQGINNKGQAFGLLTDAFREYKTKELAPEYKEELSTIKTLLNTVYSTVLSITDLSTLALQNRDRQEQERTEILEMKIKDLDFKIKVQENTINRYKAEISELKKLLDQAEQELKEKKDIDAILSRLDSLERKES